MSSTRPNSAAETWLGKDISADPELIVGWKNRSQQLEARRLPLHRDTFEELRDICTGVLGRLQAMTPVENGAYVMPERHEEYITIPYDEFHKPNEGVDQNGDDGELADLIRIALEPEGLQFINASEIQERSLSFYGISFPTISGPITFFKKISPVSSVRRGGRFFTYGETVKRVERPDLILFDDADIVVTDPVIAILSEHAYEVLAADIGAASRHISEHVTDIASSFRGEIEFTQSSIDALVASGKSRKSVAKRVRNLAKEASTLGVTRQTFENNLKKHGYDPSEFFDEDGKILLRGDSVLTFIDLVEGRLFEHDFTEAPLRADRYRTRGK